MKIYQLTSENLQGLGGPMGTERTTVNWVKPFESLESAQKYAENDYEGKDKIKWTKDQKEAQWCSGDLRWVMYHIHEVELGGTKDIAPKILADGKIDLSDLKKVVKDYMEDLTSENYHEDNEWKEYIYEECLKALYGKDVFTFINNINK
jgi:hypothetical protein